MIKVPSINTVTLYRAYAASQNVFVTVPPGDGIAVKHALTEAEVDALMAALGTADGYFKMPDHTSPRAIKLFLGATAAGPSPLGVKVTVYNRNKLASNQSGIPLGTANKFNWIGEPVYIGTVLRNSSSTPQELANGTSEPLFLSSGLWTMLYGSSKNTIDYDTVIAGYNTPIIIPVVAADIVRVEPMQIDGGDGQNGNVNALVGFIG